jgi:hypothetical protein
MLDFLRHPLYFKRHAMGKAVGQEELDKMTSLLARIREMADREGLKRGRPILIAVRVPDSVDYCRAIGFDIVRWMADDLIDLLVVSGYFRLNPWETTVALGHKYDVPVYPCLSETRLRDKEAKKVRASLACYRARAANVWNAGADGVYMFNFFNPNSSLWREIGEPATIKGLERVYCTGARGVSVINRWFSGGMRWLNRSLVSPERPRKLQPGKSVMVELNVGEKLTDSAPADVTLHLRIADLAAANDVSVSLNGKPLTGGSKTDNCLVFLLAPTFVTQGVNRIELALKPDTEAKEVLQDLLLWVRPKKSP